MKKRCRDCDTELPLDSFCINRATPDGHAIYCRECMVRRNAVSRFKQQKRKAEYFAKNSGPRCPPVAEKVCSRCGVQKLADQFRRNRWRLDGLDAWCRSCCNEHQNEYRRRKREEEAAEDRAFYDRMGRVPVK